MKKNGDKHAEKEEYEKTDDLLNEVRLDWDYSDDVITD